MDTKKKLSLVIILIICLTLILIWFSRGLLFAGGEEGIPFYNLSRTTKLLSFSWIDEGTGYPGVGQLTAIPYYSLLEALYRQGGSSLLLQSLHFFILILVGTLSYYFLLRITIGQDLTNNPISSYKYVSLIGAIFYLLNPYSMTQIFGRGIFVQYFAFALIPLFLALFIKCLKSKNLIYGALALVASYLLAGAYGSYSYIVALWFVVFLYTSFFLSLNWKDKNKVIFTLLFLVVIFIGWLAINSFWLLPVLKLAPQQLASSLDALEENLGSLRGVSKQFSPHVLVRLMHTGYFYEDLYGTIYSNFFFQVLSWIIPMTALFSLNIFRKLIHFKFYSSLFVISLFISLGSNLPLGFLFEFLFTNIPYLQIFRNPYEKFGLIFLLAYVPFFAIGVLVLSEKIAKLFHKDSMKYLMPGAIVLLVCGIFVWPMWKGIFAGGYRINAWIKVPDYYKDANDWLNQQHGDFRLLHLPLIPGDGIRYKWEHPYQGIESSEFLFDRASIAQNIPFNKSYYNVLLQRIGTFQPNIFGVDPDLTDSEFRSDKFYEELAKLNIRYIVLHNDIDVTFGGFKTPKQSADYLAKEDKIIKVNTFGELDIYKVDIGKEVGLIYSPEGKISYEKINPTFYKLKIKDAPDQFNLYFLTLYSPEWVALVKGQEIPDHFKVFSYANGWTINKGGDLEIILKYKAQDIVYNGVKISLLSFIIFATFILIYTTAKWKTKKK